MQRAFLGAAILAEQVEQPGDVEGVVRWCDAVGGQAAFRPLPVWDADAVRLGSEPAPATT